MLTQTKETDSVFSGQLGGNIFFVTVDGNTGVNASAYLDSLRDWESRNQKDLTEHDHVMAFTR